MTLVERFIEITDWPTSRKVALLSALLLPFWLIALWLLPYTMRATGLGDAEWMQGFMLAWNAGLVLVVVISLVCDRLRWNAEWTFYLLSAVQFSFMWGCVYLCGMSSTGLVVLPTVSIFVAAPFFKLRAVWSVFGLSVVAWGVMGYLQARGTLPYAPLLTDRTLEAQNHPLWFAFIYYTVFSAIAWCLFFTSLAIAARRLQESRLKQAQTLIRRYVPSQVADSILSGQQAEVEKHERRKLTIFFSDLVGFTDISEEMEPEDLSRVLNEYFSEMTRIAGKHGGTVNELAGDAVLIFFGAPTATDDKDHALRAARMAIEMQQAVLALNEKWKSAGIDVVLKVRMGLNTGVVTIGNFGSPERMKYSALGKHVNIAARLQSHCEPGRVLLSHPTWLLVQDQIPCQSKGELTLKGIIKPVLAYEISVPA